MLDMAEQFTSPGHCKFSRPESTPVRVIHLCNRMQQVVTSTVNVRTCSLCSLHFLCTSCALVLQINFKQRVLLTKLLAMPSPPFSSPPANEGEAKHAPSAASAFTLQTKNCSVCSSLPSSVEWSSAQVRGMPSQGPDKSGDGK